MVSLPAPRPLMLWCDKFRIVRWFSAYSVWCELPHSLNSGLTYSYSKEGGFRKLLSS